MCGGSSWNPVSWVAPAVQSVGNAVSSVASTVSNAVSSATQAVGKAASDVGTAALVVNQQLGDIAVNDYKTIGGVVQSLSHGQIGEALQKTWGSVVSDMNTITGGKPLTNQTLGAPNAASQTIASGQAQQAPTSLNSQTILGAPGVTGSLTTRTISGPDNTYKMDKTTMLGL